MKKQTPRRKAPVKKAVAPPQVTKPCPFPPRFDCTGVTIRGFSVGIEDCWEGATGRSRA